MQSQAKYTGNKKRPRRKMKGDSKNNRKNDRPGLDFTMGK